MSEAAKKQTKGKTITVKQIKSAAGRFKSQRQTLVALGLNKLHRENEVLDTPQARGMIASVKHLVEIKN